jgi:hypothetical protein
MPNATIQNYDDLVAAVAKIIKRQDLSSMIPIFVQMAEEYFNNYDSLQNVTARRATYKYSTNQAIFPGPTDMVQPIQAYMSGVLLDFYPSGFNSSYAGANYPQIANGYQILGKNIVVSVSQLGLFQLDYYQQLEPLSETNESNWLLEDSPVTYLAGVCHEAFSYMRDFEKAQYWLAKRDSAIDTYVTSDISSRFPSGALTIRAG